MNLTLNKKSKHFILIFLLWLFWLILSLVAIKFTIDFSENNNVFYTSPYVLIFFITIFLLSLPLTFLVACRGKIKQLKEYGMDILILIFLVAFILFTFYQWYLAYYSASNLSIFNLGVFGNERFNNFDNYMLYYTATTNAYYNIAMEKIWTLGLIFISIICAIKLLNKKS